MFDTLSYFDDKGKMQCFLDVYNGDPEATFLTKKIRKAYKEHRCGECGDTIPRGAKYEYVKGRWEGDFDEYKTCLTCVEIRSEIFCSYYYENVWDDLKENGFEPNMARLMNFSPEAQKKLIERCVLERWDFDEDEE